MIKFTISLTVATIFAAGFFAGGLIVCQAKGGNLPVILAILGLFYAAVCGMNAWYAAAGLVYKNLKGPKKAVKVAAIAASMLISLTIFYIQWVK